MYNLADWAEAPRKTVVGGRVVRLDGYQRQPANTIAMAAATTGNESTVNSLLTSGS